LNPRQNLEFNFDCSIEFGNFLSQKKKDKRITSLAQAELEIAQYALEYEVEPRLHKVSEFRSLS